MVWQPQVGPQALAIAARFVRELMFGGARGGGKSDFLLGDFLQDVDIGPAWRGIIFRRSYAELEELVTRAKEIFAPVGAQYKVQASTFVFPSGATLKMRYLEKETDADKYQGHQYTWVGWDELTNWASQASYNKLKACVRSASGVEFKRIRCSANPGGTGHHWVKEYFVDPAPMGGQLIDGKRMFIRSLLTDNYILTSNDPEYESNLKDLGSPELIRAWLEGDWNVITGAYFPEFSLLHHVIKPFKIPSHWMRFRACDWGSYYPFSVGWYAISDGYQVEYVDGKPGPYIASGAMVKYREWYGWSGKANKGIGYTGSKVADGIKEREIKDGKVSYGVIDPSAFKVDNGPSVAESMSRKHVYFRRADNQRIPGWDQVRDRLVGTPDEGPMIYFFENCVHTIRTLPAVQHDPDNPEDVNKEGEDHCADEVRYACMSRPFTKYTVQIVPERPSVQTATMDDWWRVAEEAETGYRQL